jgi:hypothetical protein
LEDDHMAGKLVTSARYLTVLCSSTLLLASTIAFGEGARVPAGDLTIEKGYLEFSPNAKGVVFPDGSVQQIAAQSGLKTILNGPGNPLVQDGVDGDFYISTKQNVIFGPKASGIWPTPGVSLVGPQGVPGDIGATGPQGIPGPAGSGFTWVNVTGASVQATSNTGYMANSGSQVTITLPAVPAVGDVVRVSGIGPSGWKIAQNAGQSVVLKDLPGTFWTARLVGYCWHPIAVASSADGTKLVVLNYQSNIYTSNDSGVNWTPHESNRNWVSVASSADGRKLVACVMPGQIFTSIDSGVTWTPRESTRYWGSVASSADGTKLVAVESGGQIYTSTNSGVTWTPHESIRNWVSVASSSDGTKLVAVEADGDIYTSTDSGDFWSPRDLIRYWSSVASSSDGTKIVAAESGGQIYTSNNSGRTWSANDSSRNWRSVASSSDGTKLVAVDGEGRIYTSIGGATWTAHDTNRNWRSVASSSDGTKLVAVDYNSDIFTSDGRTTTGTTGSISGAQYDAIELQYTGKNSIFMVLSHEGSLTVQ